MEELIQLYYYYRDLEEDAWNDYDENFFMYHLLRKQLEEIIEGESDEI